MKPKKKKSGSTVSIVAPECQINKVKMSEKPPENPKYRYIKGYQNVPPPELTPEEDRDLPDVKQRDVIYTKYGDRNNVQAPAPAFSGADVHMFMPTYETQTETTGQKAQRLFQKNPLLPLGLGFILYFFVRGAFATRSKEVSDMYMNRLMGAKLFTVSAFFGGSYYHGDFPFDRERK